MYNLFVYYNLQINLCGNINFKHIGIFRFPIYEQHYI